MFEKILGRKKDEVSNDKDYDELVQKISKMNLTEMRAYINNKAGDFKVTSDGLVEVLRRLTVVNETTSKHYIEIDDMDVKIKKSFDLVISIASHKLITMAAVECIKDFIDTYIDIIKKYDRENKQIYESKLKDSLDLALANIGVMSKLKREMDFLDS